MYPNDLHNQGSGTFLRDVLLPTLFELALVGGLVYGFIRLLQSP